MGFITHIIIYGDHHEVAVGTKKPDSAAFNPPNQCDKTESYISMPLFKFITQELD